VTRPGRSEGGSVAVELALSLPMLLLILSGVFDLGSALMMRAQMQEAAQEATSAAAHDPGAPAAAEQRAVDAVSAFALTTAEVTITCLDAGRRVRTTVAHANTPIFVSVFGVGPIDITVDNTSDVLSDDDCTP
jgi:Flp pilus assembly protein TadG